MLEKIEKDGDSVSYDEISSAVGGLKKEPIEKIAQILKSFGSSTD
jgi:hypothetical protein